MTVILLTAEKLHKSYTHRQLLSQVSFGVNEGDKIGVIGINGTGKSTLLKILAGVETPDSGQVVMGSGVRVGYLPQNPVFSEDVTILEQVRQGLVTGRQDADEYECKAILTKLGLNDYDRPVAQLSGGQKRRVALASALTSQVELLILDEPTNHIDNSMVDWLESYLARYRGALIMVTHDRYFLNRVTNRILELEGGSVYSYPSNYEKYLELKSQREEMTAASERKRQSLLKKELEWLQQGPKARGTKSRYRIERYEELLTQSEGAQTGKLELSSLSARLGKKIVEIENLSKRIEGRTLFENLSYNFLRGDRVGIIGPNGSGKSTLLKILLGRVSPDEGAVTVGDTVRFGYFSQESEELQPSLRAIDAVKEIAPEVETPDGTLSATQLMERFLFPSDLQYTTVDRLSGGERRRLTLLRVLMGAPNVLLLDEPTNDLDIQTLTILEDYLESFPGVLVTVSHDRYFLDKVVTHIFSIEEGRIYHTLGGYTAYREALEERQDTGERERSVKRTERPQRARKLRFTYAEQAEFENIDDSIAGLESRLEELDIRMQSAARDASLLTELLAERDSLQAALGDRMERWVYLNELAQRIQAQDLEG